jgi:signal transduction histidine kinase
MEFYFFRSLSEKYAPHFWELNSRLNLRTVRVSSGIVGSICILLLVLNYIFDFESLDARNAVYIITNAFLAGTSGFTFLCTFLPVCRRQHVSGNIFVTGLSFFFCICYTLSCLTITFTHQENPKNTLTMYLMGLTAVAVLWIYEYWLHLLFVGLVELAFLGGLRTLEISQSEIVFNISISVILIVFFFVVARLVFSFRANYFIQLKEIEEKNQEIQKIIKAKTDILEVVAHDLLSPFASIESMIRLLRKQRLTPDKQDKYFNVLLAECHSSRTLINDLLETARYDNEKEFSTETTELTGFLAEVQTKWETQLKGARSLVLYTPEQPVFANLNKERFDRVLDNLLTNAVKFTPENGQINMEVLAKKGHIQLNISDNGIGIPRDLQPYLFQRFTKARRKGLHGEATTGLGLSITQHLIEKHGGSIRVESAENVGTVFQITLPKCNKVPLN